MMIRGLLTALLAGEMLLVSSFLSPTQVTSDAADVEKSEPICGNAAAIEEELTRQGYVFIVKGRSEDDKKWVGVFMNTRRPIWLLFRMNEDGEEQSTKDDVDGCLEFFERPTMNPLSFVAMLRSSGFLRAPPPPDHPPMEKE